MKQVSRALLVSLLLVPLLLAEDKADLEAIYRIKTEAFQRSKVMDHLFYLTDANGPRLTGSPGYQRAAEWCVKQLKEWGLDTARLEKWGPFGRGWENEKLSVNLLAPGYSPLIGMPLAWTGSTDGVVTSEPMLAVLKSDEDLAKWKGKLKGKIVFYDAPKDLTLHEKADARRLSETDLEDLAMAPAPGSSPFGMRAPAPAPGGAPAGPPNMMQANLFRRKLTGFLRDEGVALAVGTALRGDGGTIFGAGGGSREVKDPIAPAMIALTPEHYNRVVRLLEKNIPVQLEAEVKNKLIDENRDSFNVIAEIPGGRKKNEIVMIGAHLDSWHYATGATDNAAGSAVMLEAIRILKKLNFPLDRTVRIGLWSGEEQGLLGSRAYVQQQFANAEMKTTPAWDQFSAYYNVDNGTGKIRGIYLQGNDMVRPIFEAWLAPFRDLGVTTISPRNTGGTDHLSFDRVGLPGFQFIQDPVEYDTRTHHSNMDVYDRIQRSDLMQMSAIVASMVYHTSQRESRLPRKMRPEPAPPGASGGPPTGN